MREFKQADLAPFIAAALKRKKRMAPVAASVIPTVSAYGRSVVQADQPTEGPTHHIAADITVMMNDPAEKKKSRPPNKPPAGARTIRP